MQKRKKKIQERGFTILFATLVSSIVLVIGLSILDITLKQLLLTRVSKESEIAFQAANAGLECVRHHDTKNDSFHVDPTQSTAVSVSCFGNPAVDQNFVNPLSSGDQQLYEWAVGDTCSSVSVWKFFDPVNPVDIPNNISTRPDCPANATCTIVKARGYNNACAITFPQGTVEREVTILY